MHLTNEGFSRGIRYFGFFVLGAWWALWHTICRDYRRTPFPSFSEICISSSLVLWSNRTRLGFCVHIYPCHASDGTVMIRKRFIMYMTSQRKRLLLFFDSHPDNAFSAQEIHEYLSAVDREAISLSAVYRNLSALAKAGLVVRTIPQNSQEARYRYVNSRSCKGRIHMTCSWCGRTFHADQKVSTCFLAKVLEKDGFLINPSQVTVYGLCSKCRKKAFSTF